MCHAHEILTLDIIHGVIFHGGADIPPTQESQFIIEHGRHSSCVWKFRNDASDAPSHIIRDKCLIATKAWSQLSSSKMFLGHPK